MGFFQVCKNPWSQGEVDALFTVALFVVSVLLFLRAKTRGLPNDDKREFAAAVALAVDAWLEAGLRVSSGITTPVRALIRCR
jgi:multidrug efflux pump subunit AcrB